MAEERTSAEERTPRDVGERLAQICVRGRRGGAVGEWPSANAIGERRCFQATFIIFIWLV